MEGGLHDNECGKSERIHVVKAGAGRKIALGI